MDWKEERRLHGGAPCFCFSCACSLSDFPVPFTPVKPIRAASAASFLSTSLVLAFEWLFFPSVRCANSTSIPRTLVGQGMRGGTGPSKSWCLSKTLSPFFVDSILVEPGGACLPILGGHLPLIVATFFRLLSTWCSHLSSLLPAARYFLSTVSHKETASSHCHPVGEPGKGDGLPHGRCRFDSSLQR